MATLISDELRWLADQIVNHCGYKSAVLSGLAPDPRHLENGGFHVSIEDLKAHGNESDYSNTRADDKGFNPLYGAAADVSMGKADMVLAYGRVHAVWADKTDPRRKYVNAINGWDGSGDATRLDFDAGVAKFASADHQWHDHIEIHRRYARDMTAMRAVVSIFKGETKAQWLASKGSNLTQGDDMPLTAADLDQIEARAKAGALAALETKRPYSSDGAGPRLVKAGWNPLSIRGLLEYDVEDAMTQKESTATQLEAARAEIVGMLQAIDADPGNPVQLGAEQTQALAEQLAVKLGAGLVKAIGDDTAARMQG